MTTLFVDASGEGQPRYWIYSEKHDAWGCFFLDEAESPDSPDQAGVDAMAWRGAFKGFDEGVVDLIERWGIDAPASKARKRPTVAQVKSLETHVAQLQEDRYSLVKALEHRNQKIGDLHGDLAKVRQKKNALAEQVAQLQRTEKQALNSIDELEAALFWAKRRFLTEAQIREIDAFVEGYSQRAGQEAR